MFLYKMLCSSIKLASAEISRQIVCLVYSCLSKSNVSSTMMLTTSYVEMHINYFHVILCRNLLRRKLHLTWNTCLLYIYNIFFSINSTTSSTAFIFLTVLNNHCFVTTETIKLSYLWKNPRWLPTTSWLVTCSSDVTTADLLFR